MTEDERDVAEADRVAAEHGRVEAEEVRVINEFDEEAGRVTAEGVRVDVEGERVEAEVVRIDDEDVRNEAEAARVAAEVEREEHEKRRRIAEGGPDQHVPGNTKTGRVEAEKQRQEGARKMYSRMAALIALPVALVALIPSAFGLILLQREVDHRCADAALNRTAIRSAITDGLASLGYIYEDGRIVEAGKPLAYYIDHPDERAQVLERTKKSLARFEAIDCN